MSAQPRFGPNIDVLETRLVDILNKTFQDPEATNRFMASVRAMRERIHGHSYLDEGDDRGGH